MSYRTTFYSSYIIHADWSESSVSDSTILNFRIVEFQGKEKLKEILIILKGYL